MSSIDVHIFIHGPDNSGIMQQLSDIKTILGETKMTDDEVKVLLGKVDVTTTKIGDDVKAMGAVDKVISDKIDAFLAAVPVGTVLSAENAAHLQTLADALQVNADASDVQVTTLNAIAAKGSTVVPPPPPPPIPPVG